MITVAKIKICGLYRDEDIAAINELHPDYCGFIVEFPKSHRSLSREEVRRLSSLVTDGIKKVGVFVDADVSLVTSLLSDGTIDIAQLHGNEDEAVILKIKESTGKPVIKSFIINGKSDVAAAEASPADYVLLDKGQGCGESFDWSIVSDMKREYFLAGGLNASNLSDAIERLAPFAVDISSGVETNRVKDKAKIAEVIRIVRGN